MGQSFRDELVATGMVMVVAVVGSYYLINLKLSQPEQSPVVLLDERILGTSQENDQIPGEQEADQAIQLEVVSQVTEVEPSPSPSPSPTPTPVASTVEIPYGVDREFDNEYFRASFSNARLVVGASRVFKVEVIIANKNVEADGGLHNRLHATIEMEGEVLIEEAAMSNTEIKQIQKGQQLTFTSSLSLVNQTDITRVIYDPGGDLPRLVYEVGPQL